jgi:hypothetical protein
MKKIEKSFEMTNMGLLSFIKVYNISFESQGIVITYMSKCNTYVENNQMSKL